MLVDHLGDCISQQQHVLVEGLDMALQFDSINEVHRYRNVLLAKQVQEGVLREYQLPCYQLQEHELQRW